MAMSGERIRLSASRNIRIRARDIRRGAARAQTQLDHSYLRGCRLG
jgi:hypothetical protein